MQRCGEAWVSDLTVADANHYISAAGFINCNTWIGWDELPLWGGASAKVLKDTKKADK